MEIAEKNRLFKKKK